MSNEIYASLAPSSGDTEVDSCRKINALLAGQGPAIPTTGGGGSSSSGLPVWTFQDAALGTPASGKFTTNNANPSLVTSINIHRSSKEGNNYFSILSSIGNSGFLVFTD